MGKSYEWIVTYETLDENDAIVECVIVPGCDIQEVMNKLCGTIKDNIISVIRQ